MIAEIRVALLTEYAHLDAAKDFGTTLWPRLPDTELFFLQELWQSERTIRLRNQFDGHGPAAVTAEKLHEVAVSAGDWADLIVYLAASSQPRQIVTKEDMARWNLQGKPILWLDLGAADDSRETSGSVPGIEILPREVWAKIDSVVDWIRRFAERTRTWRLERAQATYCRLAEDYPERSHAFYNPFGYYNVSHSKALDLNKWDWTSDSDLFETYCARQGKLCDQWEAAANRWSQIEQQGRTGEAISAESPLPLTQAVHDVEHVSREGNSDDVKAADAVACAVYSPARWESGVTELVQVWVHKSDQARVVKAEAVAVDASAIQLRSQALDIDVAHNARLSFVLWMDPPCEISPAIAAATWRGEPISVTFAVKTSALSQRTRALGTLEVRVDHSPVPLGILHFRVEIAPPGDVVENVGHAALMRATPTQSVFISYASEDRAEVLRRVQGLKALGIKFFQDILSLSPGQRWEQALWQHIDECDVFLLCWSKAARESEYVRKEYLRAQKTSNESEGKRPHLTILPLEGPPPPTPPSELAHLHFSDDLLYALKVEGDLAAEGMVTARGP